MGTAVRQVGAHASFRQSGKGTIDLVFVHGWSATGALFDDVISAIDPSVFRCTVLDQRGFDAPDADADSYALNDYARDLWAAVEAAGIERPVLCGHSMGGAIAQLAATQRPDDVRGLVLINPVPVTGMALPDEARVAFEASATDTKARAAVFRMASPELTDAQVTKLMSAAAHLSSTCIRQSLDAWTGGVPDAPLETITAPCLVVGSEDAFLPRAFLQDAIVERIASAKLEMLTGAAHYAPVVIPSDIADHTMAFARKL